MRAIVLLLVMVGCAGIQGPIGPQGEPGTCECQALHRSSGVLYAKNQSSGHWKVYEPWISDSIMVTAWVRGLGKSEWVKPWEMWVGDGYIKIVHSKVDCEYRIIGH